MNELTMRSDTVVFVFAMRAEISCGDRYFLIHACETPQEAENLFFRFISEVTGHALRPDAVCITDNLCFGAMGPESCNAAAKETLRWQRAGYVDAGEIAERTLENEFDEECEELKRVLLSHGRQLEEANAQNLIIASLLMAMQLMEDCKDSATDEQSEDLQSFQDAVLELVDVFKFEYTTQDAE